MNRLTSTPFFTAIVNQQSNQLETTFEEFTTLTIEINDSEEDFKKKYRILNYTKIRLNSLQGVLTNPIKAKKKCINRTLISHQRCSVN